MSLLLLGVGGSRGFDPLNLAPDLWLDAQDLTKLYQDSGGTTPVTSNNDPVGLWQDKSGNNRHVSQGTAGKRPLYKSTLYNSKPYVKADGIDDVINRAGVLISDTSEIWIRAYASLNSFPGPGSYLYPVIGQGTSQFPPCQLEFYNGFGSTAQNALYGEGVGSLELDGVSYGGGAVAGAQAHTAVGVCSGSSSAVTNTGIWLLSLDPSAGSIYYGPEAIGELFIFSAALTGANRTAMYTYLSGRW